MAAFRSGTLWNELRRILWLVSSPNQGGEQSGRPVAFVVMGHGAATALLDWQPRLCPVESLNLASVCSRQSEFADDLPA